MLSVQNLSVARGGIQILSDISFTVPVGQALVLRGPNGIGKTTLLRTLAGLQAAVSGHVSGGNDVAFAGHLDANKPALTVRENLEFWAGVFGTPLTDATFKSFDLLTLADRPAGNLSAGQKRRLGLSRLLVSGRKLWLLDEPTVSLDAANVAIFQSVLADHLKTGGMAVLSSHIDLGIDADVLDLAPYKTTHIADTEFDRAFL